MDLAYGSRSGSSESTSCVDPELSVIIPTYNGAGRIRACVEAVLSQETARRFEIIVVDDGSEDDLGAVLPSHPVLHLVRQPNRGPAAARNLGAARARGGVLLFIDDDCAPERDWIERMLEPLADPAVAAVKGAYLSAQPELVARFVQTEYEEKYDRLRSREVIDFIDTYSAAFRRDTFLAHGGFDESFVTASTEDQELSFRLARAGHRMVFAPDARVWHTHAATLSAYVRKKFKIGYWKVCVLAKHPRKIAGDAHTPTTLKLQVALAAALPVSTLMGLVFPPSAPIPFTLGALFLASSLPLTLRCLRRCARLGAVAPLLVGCRAGALAAGLVVGALEKGAGLRLLATAPGCSS